MVMAKSIPILDGVPKDLKVVPGMHYAVRAADGDLTFTEKLDDVYEPLTENGTVAAGAQATLIFHSDEIQVSATGEDGRLFLVKSKVSG